MIYYDSKCVQPKTFKIGLIICVLVMYTLANYSKNVAITFDIFRNYFNNLQLLWWKNHACW